MVSRVARQLREEQMRELASLNPAQRVALALALGERDLEMFRHANRLDREEASRQLDRARRLGRRRCRCLEEVL